MAKSRSKTTFDVPNLAHSVDRLIRQIPPGRVSTYGDIARALGAQNAARWVGEYLARHDHGDACPCFRVVRATGEVGLFADGGAAKVARLENDGIAVLDEKLELKQYRFDEFECDQPLAQLVVEQNRIPGRARIEPLGFAPQTVAGMDVSYQGQMAVVAYVLIDLETMETMWQTTAVTAAKFPYIAGFLAYRELPALLKVWNKVLEHNRVADVVMIDGNGILHHHRAGIATHFGVAANVPSLGVSKKLLCGSVDVRLVTPATPQPIIHDDELIGMSIVNKTDSRPLYISPGHRLDVPEATALAQRCFQDHRLPEPTFRADRLSREIAKSRGKEGWGKEG